MSQIASAYGLSSEELGCDAELFRKCAYAAFWERLRRHEIGPPFEHSGSVIDVVGEFLRERGIPLPVSSSAPGIDAFAAEGSVVACASPPEAAAAHRAIGELSAGDPELTAYWQDWTGDQDAQAADLMRAGLNWLQQVLQAGRSHEWVVVWVG